VGDLPLSLIFREGEVIYYFYFNTGLFLTFYPILGKSTNKMGGGGVLRPDPLDRPISSIYLFNRKWINHTTFYVRAVD
jgi:hypothetical protein